MAEASDIIAKAEQLQDTDAPAALALLRAHRPGDLPFAPAFDGAIANALLADCQPAAAADYLGSLAEQSPDELPPSLLRLLTKSMLLAGKSAEVGATLRALVDAGMAVESLGFRQKSALLDAWRQGGRADHELRQLRTALMADNAVHDTQHGVVLVYCPKVACSVLKATVVMNSPLRQQYLDLAMSIHVFCSGKRDMKEKRRMCADPSTFHFTVIRDPARRILSAYLDKFMSRGRRKLAITRDRNQAIVNAQRLAGIPANRERSISFAEFCHYLAQADDLELNPHWMPQCRIVGADTGHYDWVGRFESLARTFDMLREKFGYEPEANASAHLGGIRTNIRKLSPKPLGVAAQHLLPAQLRAYKQNFPAAEEFITPDLAVLLGKRFAGDYALQASPGA